MENFLKGKIAIYTVVKITIGIIIIIAALYFFTGLINLWLPISCEKSDNGLALSSVEALRCAVDLTSSQSPSVATCNGASQNIISSSFSDPNLKNGCKRIDDSKTANLAEFECQYNRYETVFESSCVGKKVKCGSSNGIWSCTVLEFELPQNQLFRNFIKNVVPGSEIFYDRISQWIGAVGQPDFVLSYEYFPSAKRVLFTYDKASSALLTSVALGGLLNLVPGKGLTRVSVSSLKQVPGTVLALFKKETYSGLKGKVALRFAEKAGPKAVDELLAARTASSYLAVQGLDDTVGRNIVETIASKDGVRKFTDEVTGIILKKSETRGVEHGYLSITLRNKMDYFWSDMFEKYVRNCRDLGKSLCDEFLKGFDNIIREEMAGFIKTSDLGISDKVAREVADDIVEKRFNPSSLKTAKDELVVITNKYSAAEDLLDRATKNILKDELEKEINSAAFGQLIDRSFVEAVKKYSKVKNLKDVRVVNNLLDQLDKRAEKISEIAYRDLITKLHIMEAHSDFTFKSRVIDRIEKSLLAVEAGDSKKLVGLEDTGAARALGEIARNKAPALLKGITGLPGDIKDLPKRSAIMASVYIIAYNVMSDETNEALHRTCGGNTLCLMQNRLLAEGEGKDYWTNFILGKNPNIFVTSRVATLVGEEFEQAYVLSPCKSDVKVTLDKGSTLCRYGLQPAGRIYYRIKELQCYVSNIENDPVPYPSDDYEYCINENKRRAGGCIAIQTTRASTFATTLGVRLDKIVTDCSNVQIKEPIEIKFWKEDESSRFRPLIFESEIFDVSIDDCKRKYGTDDIFKCVNDDSLSKIEEWKAKERKRFEEEAVIVGKANERYLSFLKQINFRAIPINIQKDVNGKLVPVSSCESPYVIQELKSVIEPTNEKADRIALRFEKIKDYATGDYDHNYCVANNAKLTNQIKATCEAAVIASPLIVSLFTGGATSQVALFAIGSSGAVCEDLMNDAGRWPNTQQ